MSNFFSNIVQNRDISRYSNDEPLLSNTNDATLKAILKYKNHPSIIAILNKCKDKGNLNFIEVEQKQIENEILKLHVNKVSQSSEIPEILKHADITPLYKKGKKNDKGNYRPVSILPNLSKIFEKYMLEEVSPFFENIFSKYQCGFRKGFSTQQCLLAMLKKWKKSVDNSNIFGALLTDLSKAFDCLDHELLIAKLNAYGFSLTALKLGHNYLSNRKQRTKINSTYSSLLEIIFGIPQGSILGPLLFNIFLIEIFFIIEDTDIASFANDNTPYVIADNIDGVIKPLEEPQKFYLNGSMIT